MKNITFNSGKNSIEITTTTVRETSIDDLIKRKNLLEANLVVLQDEIDNLNMIILDAKSSGIKTKTELSQI